MRFKDITKGKIDPNYYNRLAFVESSGNPNAQAKTSSAAGLYQFTEGTWKGLVEQMGLDYSLEDRFDPEKSRQVVEQLTQDNAKYLKRKLGREIKPSELYLAHFLGMGGSRSLLQAYDEDPTVSAADVLSEAQIRANQSVFKDKDGNIKSIGDIYNWANKKMSQDLPEEFLKQINPKPKPEPKLEDYFDTEYAEKATLLVDNPTQWAKEVFNPKKEEAKEMIDSRKQHFGYLSESQFKDNRKKQVASMQKGGDINPELLKKEKEWVKNWISHPEFEKRLTKNLETANEKRHPLTKDYFPLGNKEEFFNQRAKRLQRQGVEHLDNTKTFVGNGSNNEKVIDAYLNEPVNSLGSSRANLRQLEGEQNALRIPLINKQYGSAVYAENDGSSWDGKIRNTAVHEYTHATNIDAYIKDAVDKPRTPNTDTDEEYRNYVEGTTEVFPRLMSIRYAGDIKPEEEVTKEKLEEIKSKMPDEGLFQVYSDEEILEMLNTIASNKNKSNKGVAYAQKGGVTPRQGVRKNPDGTESTHLMAYGESDGKYVAYPTLFQDEEGSWYELNQQEAFKEAIRKKELYSFNTEEEAKKFAAGSWKTPKRGRKNKK